MIYMNDIDLDLIEHIGVRAAEILNDNAERWQELYDYIGVVRNARTIGFKLVPNPSKEEIKE